MIPDRFFSSISGTLEVPPLVTSKVSGPDATLIWLGVQPESTSVTATFFEPFAPFELEPQPATASAAIAQTVRTAALDETFIFN